MTIRAVLLDLDDTLLPDAPAARAALRQTCRRAAEGRRLDPDRLHRTIRRTASRRFYSSPQSARGLRVGMSSWEALWGSYADGGEEWSAYHAWTRVYRRRVWEESLRMEGTRDPVLAADLARMFVRERRRRLRPFPDALPLLEALRGRHAVAIVTNGAGPQQREKLERSGLALHLPVVVTSEDAGIKKPDPRPFEIALERLGVGPDEAVMVGNSLGTDVLGARNAGVRAIWLDRSGRGVPSDREPPEEVIRSLAELPERL